MTNSYVLPCFNGLFTDALVPFLVVLRKTLMRRYQSWVCSHLWSSLFSDLSLLSLPLLLSVIENKEPTDQQVLGVVIISP